MQKPRIYKWVIFGFALFYWTLYIFQNPGEESVVKGQQQGAATGLTFSFGLIQFFEWKREKDAKKEL